ncbi:MAG: 4Fe-4S binding protein [Deltaproteobacteria bacterium]|nr:4Fe-4S binding protein [Deltaproteobacteria bacterium]
MIRKVINIDEEKCDGCGLCVSACLEGAIGLVDGKAKLLREDYCDGLGNCLPVCPAEAISFEEREAAEFDENAVKDNMAKKRPETLASGCPGAHSKTISRESRPGGEGERLKPMETHLNQWPVQIRLVPENAPYFDKADLLVAADCAAYAYGNFHGEYMRNKITIIGCPKLDDEDYSDKLTAILKLNDIKSVTVARMEVPCCAGIENAVKTALKNSGKLIAWQVATISTDGKIVEN